MGSKQWNAWRTPPWIKSGFKIFQSKKIKIFGALSLDLSSVEFIMWNKIEIHHLRWKSLPKITLVLPKCGTQIGGCETKPRVTWNKSEKIQSTIQPHLLLSMRVSHLLPTMKASLCHIWSLPTKIEHLPTGCPTSHVLSKRKARYSWSTTSLINNICPYDVFQITVERNYFAIW